MTDGGVGAATVTIVSSAGDVVTGAGGEALDMVVAEDTSSSMLGLVAGRCFVNTVLAELQ